MQIEALAIHGYVYAKVCPQIAAHHRVLLENFTPEPDIHHIE